MCGGMPIVHFSNAEGCGVASGGGFAKGSSCLLASDGRVRKAALKWGNAFWLLCRYKVTRQAPIER